MKKTESRLRDSMQGYVFLTESFVKLLNSHERIFDLHLRYGELLDVNRLPIIFRARRSYLIGHASARPSASHQRRAARRPQYQAKTGAIGAT